MNKRFRLIALVVGAVLLAILLFVGFGGTGYIQIEAPGYEVDLTLRGIWMTETISVIPGSEPIRIRAGRYEPERLTLRLVKDADHWWALRGLRKRWDELRTIKVMRNDRTVLRIGPPLIIRTDVQNNNRLVSIGLSLVGRAGEHYGPEVLSHAENPPAAKFRIVDETGKVLASGTFEYG